MDFFNLNEVTAKAKVINVTGGDYSLTLLCLVKEFSYICNDRFSHVGSVVFDDYSHKMAITVLKRPHQVESDRVSAYSKAQELVEGDIIEFTLHRNGNLYAFNVVESKHKCHHNMDGFEYLANKFGRDSIPKPTHYLEDNKVEKREKEQIVEVQPVENVGYEIVTDKNTKFTIEKKYTSVIPQVGDSVVFYTIIYDLRIIGVELNGVLLYFFQHGNLNW